MSSSIRRFWSYVRNNETAKGLFLVGVVLLAAVGIWEGTRLALSTEYPVLVVSSGSMCQRLQNPSTNQCTLAIGDLIVIKGQDPSTIAAGTPPVGSIIVFRPPAPYSYDPNYLVVHRVIGIIHPTSNSGYLFQTRGDANGQACNCAAADDPWDSSGVPASNVVGVFQYTIPVPYLGSTILAIRGFMYDDATGQPRPQGLAIIVLLIVALFAFEIIEPSNKKKSPSPPSPPSSPSIPTKDPVVGDGTPV